VSVNTICVQKSKGAFQQRGGWGDMRRRTAHALARSAWRAWRSVRGIIPRSFWIIKVQSCSQSYKMNSEHEHHTPWLSDVTDMSFRAEAKSCPNSKIPRRRSERHRMTANCHYTTGYGSLSGSKRFTRWYQMQSEGKSRHSRESESSLFRKQPINTRIQPSRE